MIYLLVIIADIVWGLNIVVTKLNYEYFHPLFLIFLKILFSFMAMLVYIKLKDIPFEKVRPLPLLINTHLINTLNFLLTYFALMQIKGTASAALNCLAPFAMMIIIYLDTRKIRIYDILFLVFSLFGFFYTINFNWHNLAFSHYLFIIALFIYNLGNYRVKKINDNNIFVYNVYMLFIALIEMTVICLFIHPVLKPVNPFCLWLFVLTSGIGYAYIQCISFYSIKHLGALTTSVLLGLGPIFTYIFSIFFLKENVSFQLLTGFIIIFLSSLGYILYREKYSQPS